MTHPKMDAWLGNTKRILVLNREAMISNNDRNDWARYFAKQGIKVIFTNGKLGMGISYAVSFQKHPVHFHFMDRESSRRKRLCGRVTSNNKNMEQPCPSVDTDSIGKENSKVELPKLSVERQQMKKKKKNAGFNLRKSLAWDKIKEEEVVWKAETISEYDSSRNEDNKRNSDQMSDDKEAKEGNRAGEVWREGKTQIRDDGFGKVRKCEKLDKKKSFVVKDTSDRAKENMNQETERRDDSLGNKTQENEKQESYEHERNEEEVVGKAETIDEYGSSRKIHEHEVRKSNEKSEKMQKRKQWMIKKPKKETELGQYCERFKQKLER